MTLATQFFSAVLDNNDRPSLHLISPEWFNPDELVIYNAIIDHIRQFGQLPSQHTMRQQGHRLPRATEPVAYYITQLPQRAIHEYYREHLPALMEALDGRRVPEAVAMMRQMLEYATLTGNRNLVRNMQDELREIGREAQEARGRAQQLGITTGFAPLDEVMGGLLPSDLYAIVGRPGMGKSYQLFHMANSAWLAGASVLIVSMEMGVRQCARRIVGMNTGINPDAIRRGQISSFMEEEFFGRLTELGGDAMPAMHFLAGDVNKTVGDIDMLVQELMPDVLYFDAAYLASPSRKRQRSSRREYLIDTMEETKGIAITRGIPVVMSTQLGRSAAKVTGDKGGLDLSMIAETDAIGQIVSAAVAVTPGAGAYSRLRRTNTMLKNREGEVIKFESNFNFAPMNFRAIPGSERTPDGRPWTSAALAGMGLEDSISTDNTEDEAPQGYVD